MFRLVAAAGLVMVAFGLCGPASANPTAANGRIVFADRLQPQLWTIQADGSDPQLLATFPTSPDYLALLRGVSFSADGSRLAVLYEQLGTNTLCGTATICWSIVMLNGDGSGQRVIYSNEHIGCGCLALSPDGLEVAFTLVARGGEPLFTIDSNGNHVRQVTRPRQGETDSSATWSPDGSEIAFDSNRDQDATHTWSLYVVNVQNHHLRRVVTPGGNDLEPDWSPDGQRLVFIRTFGYPDYAVFSVNVDGTQEQQLRRDLTATELPQWSPAADKILYEQNIGLTVADANGGNPQVIGPGGLLAYDWRPNF